jgi:Glycosyl transferase family 2
MRLNLGCSDRHVPGHLNVDLSEPADLIADLSKTWPWEDSSIEGALAHDIIEHLPDKLHTMNELWRVLKNGATVEIAVPTTEGSGAFQDPTHVSFWNRRSFLYYEAGNIYRERFAKAYGIKAAFAVRGEHLEQTMDGPRLTITLTAVKPDAPQQSVIYTDIDNRLVPVLQGCGVIGAMRIKNEARWIKRSIESQLDACNKILVLDDGSTDGTQDIVRSFGDRCVLIQSPFEGVNEGRDKNFILKHLVAANPAWVLWIDGDETLERGGGYGLLREMSDSVACVYSMRVMYLWDNENLVRTDGVYGQFRRPSLFRVMGQPVDKLFFSTGGDGPNFHCGNVPQGLVGSVLMSTTRIKHFGYLDWAERQRKYEWYNKIDPNNDAEDCYRHIIEMPGARHAPGPTVLEEFVE